MTDNNNEGGSTPSNVLSFENFRNAQKGKDKPKSALMEAWPTAIPPEDLKPVTVTQGDPDERRILISTAHGDILMSGYLGLSQTFLAVGAKDGTIKFAAAPNMWQYASDVTNDPKYSKEPA